jgi:hypothetical protein
MSVAKIYNQTTEAWEPVIYGSPGTWSSPQDVSKKINDYTLVASDAGRLVSLEKTTSANLYAPGDEEYFSIGQRVDILQYGIGQIFVVPVNASVFVRSAATNKTRARYSVASLIKIGSNEWLLTGDLAVS